MKTLKTVNIELVILKEGEYIPSDMTFGIFYYSPEFKCSNHLCLCGCGHQCFLPIKNGEWNIDIRGDKFSISPSILQRFDCKSHYIITNNKANFV